MYVHASVPNPTSFSTRYCDLYRYAVQWFGRFGYYIYGDAAYPLRSWLMVGFRNPSTEDEEKFNTHGSKARVVVNHRHICLC